MKARCLESLGLTDGNNGAFGVYKILHEKYANTDAAKVSYLYHARTEANRGNFVAAQQLCRTLADADPKGIYAYDAISDAAQYARKLGLEADYKIALTMLDKLCKDFPDNPRNFYARLSQAEILRLLNAFADARKLYEEIINKYSSHPEIHLAGWARRLRPCPARKNPPTPTRFSSACTPFPICPWRQRAEAAFKWRLCARTRRTFARSQRNALGHVGTAVEERRCRRRRKILDRPKPLCARGLARSQRGKTRRSRRVRTDCKIQIALLFDRKTKLTR